jgi:pimeloyl-ACP methyl ester carboxylesterase
MPRSQPVDGFSVAYDRHEEGLPVVLLHGWPGMRSDHRALVPLLGGFEVVVPDLRGFGESDKHVADPAMYYSAAAQARSVAGLMEELRLDAAIVAGYDVGSRVAQALARAQPGRVRALVLAPPLPGIGQRILTPDAMREFWYQPFHRLDLAERLIDGDRDAVRSYLRHFWDHWGGPGFTLTDAELDALVEHYAAPGAFVASINWYRAGSGGVAMSLAEQVPTPQGRIAAPTRVLWPEHDPLFPREWGDRLDEFFADVTITDMPGTGHFSPLEAPEAFAAAIRELSAWTRA